MGNIDMLVKNTSDVEQFVKGYVSYIAGLLENMDAPSVAKVIAELESSRKNGNMVFFAGNGGSASTASHMVNDLAYGCREHVDPPFKAMALSDNVAAMTAIANDTGYDEIFIRQMQVYFQPGDKLVAISASGNSSNIVKAAEWVKSQGGMVISFLGFNGGKLADISDISIIVKTPKGEYGPVEDVHMVLDHLIYTWMWQKKRWEGKQ